MDNPEIRALTLILLGLALMFRLRPRPESRDAELTLVLLGLALMFLPNAIRVRRKVGQCETVAISNPKRWQIWLSVIAFLQAIAFVAIGIACEAAGTHWIVGLLCACGSLLCSATVCGLFGLRPRHFVS
ncbi:MAG: hypothetical protein KDB03_01570 [Planctomycetales bacterium]|nr:hypothetical protein [Planctomycetales bacterium]